MSSALRWYTFMTIIFGCSCWNATAYVASSANQRQLHSSNQQQNQQQQQQQQFHHQSASGLMAYPAAYNMNSGGAVGMVGAPTTGSVSFQPHDSEEMNERSVYDPGDELLRALNAEIAATGQELGTLPEEPDYADTVYNEMEVANKFDMLRKLERDIRDEEDIVHKSAILMKMLEDSSIDVLPVIYVEEEPTEESNEAVYPNSSGNSNGMAKRSRYYRRYPWKRHNRNRTYEPELRYACTPTKEDIFKLLVNLHEGRKGNHSKTVNFCNRKRPAKAIFTNIRFLG